MLTEESVTLYMNFFIPVLSIMIGIALLVAEVKNKRIEINLKSYNIILNAKSFIHISPVLFIITILARSYCLSLINDSSVFNISLLIIQSFILVHFTVITNLTTNVTSDENNLF